MTGQTQPSPSERHLAAGTLDSFRRTGDRCYLDNADPDVLRKMVEILVDDDALERANEALCRFVFPGYVVPRSEMVRAVADAMAGGDWRARLPARRVAIGERGAS